MYGGIVEQVDEAMAASSETTVCLVGQPDVLYPFLAAILPPHPRLRFVSDANRTGRPGCERMAIRPARRWLAVGESDHERLCARPQSCARMTPSRGTAALHLDVQALLSRVAARSHGTSEWRPESISEGYIVLVQREVGRRGFEASEAARFSSRLRAATGKRVVVSHGIENGSLARTIALYARADGVVGVHGADLANAVFAVQPVCVVEISSWLSENRKEPWRAIDQAVARWSSNVHWMVHRIAPEQILRDRQELRTFWSSANADPEFLWKHGMPAKHNADSVIRKRDLMLLFAPTFHLGEHDADDVAGLLRRCWSGRSAARRR